RAREVHRAEGGGVAAGGGGQVVPDERLDAGAPTREAGGPVGEPCGETAQVLFTRERAVHVHRRARRDASRPLDGGLAGAGAIARGQAARGEGEQAEPDDL